MKQLLLLALALSLAVANCLFDARTVEPPYAFEAEVDASGPGHIQIYYDLGRGVGESDSVSRRVYPTGRLHTVRLPLPAGRYRALRFDPIDNDSAVSFANPRIVDRGDRTVFAIQPERFEPNLQAGRLAIERGIAALRPTPGSADPNLFLPLDPPLKLADGWRQSLRSGWGGIFWNAAILFVLLSLARRAWMGRAGCAAAARRRPHLALLAIALGAAVASSYPVVFASKSFVSPNDGAALLYHGSPAIPGYADTRMENTHGADIGALMWSHLPYSAVEHRSLFEDGEWPLWNRYNSCGVTLLGQGQSMLGDPLDMPVLAAGASSWAWDLKFLAAKVLFACGVAWCVWELTRDLSAASLLALAAPFVGFYNFRVNHPAIFSFSYAPWILCAWLRMAAAPNGRRFAADLLLWSVAGTAELASGTVKEAFVLLGALNAGGAVAWLLTPAAARGIKARQFAAIAVCGAAWLLITAPLWLTFIEALRTAYTVYESPQAWLASSAWVVGLFDDLFYREPNLGRVFIPAGNFLFLFGVLWAVAQPRRLAASPGAWICLVISLAGIAMGFGFVPAEWILAVPGLRNIYHIHNTFGALAVVASAVAAGWGIHAARERLRAPRAWLPLGAVVALLAALLAAYFRNQPDFWIPGDGPGAWKEGLARHEFFFFNLALLLTAGAALAWLAFRPRRGAFGAPSAAVLALALTALLYRNGLHLPWMKIGPGGEYLNRPALRADLTAPSDAVEFVRRAAAAEPSRVCGLDAVLFTGFASVYGLENINGPDAIMNRKYRELAEATGLATGSDWHFPCSSADLPRLKPVMDFLGVRFLLADGGEPPERAGYKRVASLDLDVFRSDTAWPRAFFTDRVAVYETAGELAGMILNGDGRPFAAIQEPEAPPAGTVPRGLEGRAFVPATRYRLTGNTTAFDVEAPGPGLIVLCEAWLPRDFQVVLDGKTVPYYRINHAFKGVLVTASGVHHVKFSYWPASFGPSLVLSAIGFVIFASVLYALVRTPPRFNPLENTVSPS